ncbi:MAG: DNA-directed polymerase subunit beta [Chloroflexota bacterium]|jgi:DNA-directed RNA polymerase subunit beta
MPSRTNRAGSTGNRKLYSRIPEILEIPNLIDLQTTSFAAFVGPEWIPGATPLPKGTKTFLAELLEEISPIRDFTGKRMELAFLDYEFKDPKVSEEDARTKDATYARPLMVTAELKILETGEIRSQQIYMGDFPWMTSQGTFIINGAERVVVSQLVRSPGVFYTDTVDPVSGRALWSAKVIPNRGAWLEFETSGKDQLYVKVDRKRKLPATSLLRAVGYETNDEIAGLFSRMPSNPEHPYIANTLEKDTTATRSEALVEVYKRLRPGDPPTGDNARSLVENLFFNARRYDLGRVGRYKFTQRLKETAGLMGLELPGDATRTLTREDLAAIVGHLIIANEGGAHRDVTDHLGNRRVRANGELIQNAFRVGLLRMERVIKERMTIQEDDKATPSALVNVRPVVAAMKEFFGGSQLSQFMDQTNPLAELTSKRRLSALGPGGLSRERAGFDVRDVHHSHYGRICPIETPEGPNIGLIGSLATFGRVNDLGFIETPYRRVKEGRVTSDVVYLPADEEERFAIAQANAELDENSHLVGERIYCRKGEGFELVEPSKVEFMDVSPKQVVSVATALIPFLEHDDANRALMGSNMMRQAVPLVSPHSPVVGTGVEGRAARDSGQVVIARRAGVVTSVAADLIVVEPDDASSKKDLDRYVLLKFVRSNQGTCLNHRPSVQVGDRVTPGQVIADSMSTDQGELALGQNVVVAYMSWEGYNYEDAIIISERLVREDVFTSIHIEKHETEARETKLGPEEITRDIANVPEELLASLDEKGVIHVGAAVRPGDILVGKITPKGETEVTAEERLLRAIFGEKAREVKDSSLRLPHGERGTVVEVREFLREDADLSAGVNQLVRVSVAQKRKISVGDKMAGRHGNKGVVSRILPVEDMPFLPDGTPVDVILNPLGVPSRMNIGQLLETHLGWALAKQSLKGATPVFDGATEEKIIAELEAAGLPPDGKITLRDGKSGKEFDRPVTVGVTYMLKLHHLVEDKIHARSTGPYSLITQQPLGGKAQFGGQRFGEMEVWALQAYGAANILQEILTVKSDDVVGRVQAYEAIVKGERIQAPGVPESFKVLVKELQSLGINVEILNAEDEQIELLEDPGGYATPNLGINLSGFESGADF